MYNLKLGSVLGLNHPTLGYIVYEVVEMGLPCPEDSDDDYMFMRVIWNDNWGLDDYNANFPTDGYMQKGDKVGTIIKSCRKTLEKELTELTNTFKLFSDEQAAEEKNRITIWFSN